MQAGSPFGIALQSQSGPRPVARWRYGKRTTTIANRPTTTSATSNPRMSTRVGYQRGHRIVRSSAFASKPDDNYLNPGSDCCGGGCCCCCWNCCCGGCGRGGRLAGGGGVAGFGGGGGASCAIV